MVICCKTFTLQTSWYRCTRTTGTGRWRTATSSGTPAWRWRSGCTAPCATPSSCTACPPRWWWPCSCTAGWSGACSWRASGGGPRTVHDVQSKAPLPASSDQPLQPQHPYSLVPSTCTFGGTVTLHSRCHPHRPLDPEAAAVQRDDHGPSIRMWYSVTIVAQTTPVREHRPSHAEHAAVTPAVEHD